MKRVFLALAFFVLGHVACAEVFKDGETVCFLGDSISHGGRFHGFIYDYYLTRFPGRTIRFVNAGISGDSAGGAWGRLEEDVLAKKATSVVVMFGMNDVGRGNYVASPDARQLAAQQASLDRYRVAMDRLLGRLKGELNPRLLLATPQMRQAAAVAKLNESRRSTETALRNFAAVRWFLRNRQVDPDDFAAVRSYAETKMAKTGYYESKVPDYLVKWETRGEIIAKVASFEREAFDARKPVARRYALSLVP